VIDSSGHVVVVTGGNSGIGLGIARGVARAGASFAIWSRRQERNPEAVTELEVPRRSACGATSATRTTSPTLCGPRWTGFGHLDCLVADAGTAGNQPFTDFSLAEWHRVLQVNLDGAFFCLREAGRASSCCTPGFRPR
jgi:NAD(P)-dependent dehydrogenase (short-subunit alcohol dehydrogenase family)